MLWIESALLLLALLLAFVNPMLGAHWAESVEAGCRRLSHSRVLAVALVGAIALILRAAMLPIFPIPEPLVHDEFGYLLAADTFAQGRLTNPTPPMWTHFETFHVMFHPTYASIYPPAQGLALAFGKVVFGHPFWGVWLSVGVMCAAITWMLQAWLPPEWALLGGALSVLRYGVFSYWADSYWGGAVAAIGGALVLGALPRIKESQNIRDALLMGLGLAILANSRPYEGFVFSLPVALLLLIWMFGRNRPRWQRSLRRVVAPLTLCLAFTAFGVGYYQWRLTGNPFRMPYQIERRTYAIAPYMIWQSVRPEPAYHHATMRKMFVEEEMNGREVSTSFTGLLLRSYLIWSFFFGPALALPLCLLVFALPRNFSLRDVGPSTTNLLVVMAVCVLGSLLVNFYSPHYSAPYTGLLMAMALLPLRCVRGWSASGRFLSRAVVVICVLSFLVRGASGSLHIPRPEFYEFAWYQQGRPSFGRATIEGKLQREPGNQLVIVRYGPDHKPFAEWVYNDADIDKAKIVWAREMSGPENQRLLHAFGDRRVYMLEADETPPKLEPYSGEIGAKCEDPLAIGDHCD